MWLPRCGPKHSIYSTALISVGEMMMRSVFRAVARKTQCDEHALRLACLAVVLSVIGAVMLEKVLA